MQLFGSINQEKGEGRKGWEDGEGGEEGEGGDGGGGRSGGWGGMQSQHCSLQWVGEKGQHLGNRSWDSKIFCIADSN